MRVLFVMPHYVGPPSDARVPITESNVWPVGRLLALHQSLTTLHRSFGPYRHACGSTAVPDESAAHGVTHLDVLVLTQPDHHVLDHLRFDPSLYEARFVAGPPLHLGFEVKRVFAERAGDYDYFVHIDDDILIHDREFFRKLAWFQGAFGPRALLQPVRFEMSGRGLPVKAVIDRDLPLSLLAPFRRKGQEAELAAAWNGVARRFELPTNPHAAFHAVSAEQLRLWMNHPTFASDDAGWIGPVESAATRAPGVVFDIYKPASPDSFFLEVEHFGASEISRSSGNGSWGEGPALAIVDAALQSRNPPADRQPGASDPLLDYAATINDVLAPRLRAAERTSAFRRIAALEHDKQKLTLEVSRLQQASTRRAGRQVIEIARALFTRPVRQNLEAIVRRLPLPKSSADQSPYAKWCERWDRIGPDDRAAMSADVSSWSDPPGIAVVMPTYESNPAFLEAAIASVREQAYPHWTLAISDDGSTSADVRRILTSATAEDARIRITFRPANGGTAAASNTALGLVEADWVALLDHDDLLPPHALYMVARTIREHPDAQLVYSDDDNIDQDGVRHSPCFRTDFDLDLLLGQNMISHLGVYRVSTLRELGGFRSSCEDARDLDVALRFAGHVRPDQIRHIPHVLYHRRRATNGAEFLNQEMIRQSSAACGAVEDFLRSKDIEAEITPSPWRPFLQTRRTPPTVLPNVSIIVPTRDRLDLLRPCITSLLRVTQYPAFDVVILDNGSTAPDMLDYFQKLAGHRQVSIVHDPRPFNYSAMHNRVVPQVKGEIVALLNDDTEIMDSGWLTEMVTHAVRPDVGAVGAKLLFPDGTIQHAGILTGTSDGAYHAFTHTAGPGYFGRAELTHAVAAVTGACLVMRKSNYVEAGGMDEALRVCFNDVDLCLRLRARGLLIIYTPHAVLLHKQSQSRGPNDQPERSDESRAEIEHVRATWGEAFDNDPYFNPNLGIHYDLAEPPRRMLPWRSTPA